MRPLLSWVNWLDQPGVTLSVDNEQGNMLGSNLLTENISGEAWRAAYAGTTRNIRVDLGATREIGAIGLFCPRDGVQPLQSDRVRIRLSQTTVDGGEQLDTGTKGMSFDTQPWGSWVYPVAAGVRPNLLWNPSSRDNTVGWDLAGSQLPLQFGPATNVNALRDVGGLLAQRSGSTLTPGNNMGMQFTSGDYTCIPVGPGVSIQVQALVASVNCSAFIGFFAFDAGFNGLGTFSGPAIAGKTGQWKYQPSEWTRTSTTATTPASTALVLPYCLAFNATTATDPAVSAAEFACYVADPSGATPVYSDHYVTLASNITSLEAVVFARYITISITSTRATLDIGRLWIGPAMVGAYIPTAEDRGLDDAGEVLRAPVSGITYAAPGGVARSFGATIDQLSESEARRAAIISRTAGQSRQVLAIRDVQRGRETAMLGRLSTPPMPVRSYAPGWWKMGFSVKEDL